MERVSRRLGSLGCKCESPWLLSLPDAPERVIAATLDSVDTAIDRLNEKQTALQSSKASTADAPFTVE